MKRTKTSSLLLAFALLAGVGADAGAESSPYLRLRVLVVVYPNTFTDVAPAEEIQHLWDEVAEVEDFYWRASGLRIHLAVEHVVIDRLLMAEDFRVFGASQDAYWLGNGTVVEDLLALGYPKDVYDGIVAFYAFERGPGHSNQYKGATVGAGQGLRPLGAAGYVGIPMDFDPLTWNRTLEHEFMHLLSHLFRESTYPDFPDDILHNPQRLQGVYDWDDTWIAWLLDFVPEESYFDPEGIWGSVESFPDADSDRVPDTDSNIDTFQFTEETLGSSPALVDTDGDGLSDHEEASAALMSAYTERRFGIDPARRDTDGDGVEDGNDKTPLEVATTEVAYGTATVDGAVAGDPYTRVVSFVAEDPQEIQADLWMAWDRDFFYVALDISDDFVSTRDAVFVHIDAASDGFLYQGDENYEIIVQAQGPTGDASRVVRTWLSDKTLDDTVLPAADVSAAYVSGPDGWRVEIGIPARAKLGFPGQDGTTFRCQVFLQDRDGLALADEKRHHFAFGRYTPVTFRGHDCNSNGISDAEDIATGESSDCNTNNIPDECDLASGDSRDDCNEDGVPDECQLECLEPVALCRDVTMSAGEDCLADVAPSDVDDGSLDPQGEPLTFTLEPSGPFALGETAVLLHVESNSGYSSSCSAMVSIVDDTPPTILCPGVVTVPCVGGEGSVADFEIVAGDTCTPNPNVVCTPSSGTLFPPGSTSVTCTATDAAGNVATCTFDVVVTCGNLILPGDCNADGELDISDGLCLLIVLFLGTGRELPCGDGTILDTSNQALMSWGEVPDIDLSDAVALLNWQFLGGPPHVLGTDCTPIVGCPEICPSGP